MTRVLHDILNQSAAKVPTKDALFFKSQTMSYSEIEAQTRTMADFIVGAGINKGDRAAFWMEKRFEEVVSIFAISTAGAAIVPIRRLSTSDQVVHILNDSGARAFITTSSRLTELRSRYDELPHLTLVIVIGDAGTSVNGRHTRVQERLWSDIVSRSADAETHLPRVVETDLAAILYTSGSTGKPKGVVLNHRNIVAGAFTVSEYVKNNENDRLLSILPFNFDYGLNQLTSAFLHQAQIVLLDPLFPKDVLRTVEKFRVTGLAAVAATWIQLLQIPWDAEKLICLRYMTNSGGAIPEHHVIEIVDRLPKAEMYLMYGLTEAFRSTFLDPGLVRERPTSMGKAIPGEEVIIVGEDDKPVKSGQIGELVHRGALVAQGYWNDPENTAVRFRPDPLRPGGTQLPGYVVYSGDFIRIDEEGFLYFVGRKDEMIKYAGNRVSPTEVEEIIYKLPEVRDVMVLGIPDEMYGHIIKAVVSADIISGKEIIAHCKKLLPPYMIPADVEIWDELPRNSNGKIDRSTIKKTVFAALRTESERLTSASQ